MDISMARRKQNNGEEKKQGLSTPTQKNTLATDSAQKADKKNSAFLFKPPHPEPDEKQQRLTAIVEGIANAIKRILLVISYIFKPITAIINFFQKRAENKRWKKRESEIPENEKTPPTQDLIHIANETQAFDHRFYYKVKDGRIWFKPIAATHPSAWKLFSPDGLPRIGVKVRSISSDGENLIAIDDQGVVNYVHTHKIAYSLSKNDWKIDEMNTDWTDHWLSIPIIGEVVGRKQGHYLTLPEDAVGFAISQKGPETGYYTDISGKNQPEFLVGVTTLYCLCRNGRIRFADPWLPNKFDNEITAPEDGQFVAESMSAAASTIFLMRRDQNGNPMMYTRFADFDSLGSNPLLPASYDPDNHTPLIRRLPAEDWVKQPTIELTGQARLTSKITIIQTGRGQACRELRVEGTDKDGKSGYYTKSIYSNHWSFQHTEQVPLEFKDIPRAPSPPAPPINFVLSQFSTKTPLPLKSVALNKFLRHGLNERGLHTTLELTLKNDRHLTIPLYARRGLDHLLLKRNEQPNWLLVLPKIYRDDPDPGVQAVILALFGKNLTCDVDVDESAAEDIKICSKNNSFKFTFSPETSHHAIKKNLASSAPTTIEERPVVPVSDSVVIPATQAQVTHNPPDSPENHETLSP